jgi:hypothetical protein
LHIALVGHLHDYSEGRRVFFIVPVRGGRKRSRAWEYDFCAGREERAKLCLDVGRRTRKVKEKRKDDGHQLNKRVGKERHFTQFARRSQVRTQRRVFEKSRVQYAAATKLLVMRPKWSYVVST